MTVHDEKYIPNLVDAVLADNERGSHQMNNEASDRLKQEWPTLIEMASLIEKQRDLLLVTLQDVLDSMAHEIPLDDARAVINKVKRGLY